MGPVLWEITSACCWTGLAGEGLWEEALHDMVVENGHELINEVVKIYRYKKWGNARPDDADQIEKDMESRIVRTLNHIQKVAESRGTKFIVNDQVEYFRSNLLSNPGHFKTSISKAKTPTTLQSKQICKC